MAFKIAYLIIAHCCIGLLAISDNVTSTLSPQQRYQMRKSQQLCTLLKKPGSNLQQNGAITNRISQGVLPSQDEKDEIREKLNKVPGGIGVYPKGVPSSVFSTDVMEETRRITDYLISIPTLDEFMKTCTLLRELVNEEIYITASSTAMKSRPDTEDTTLPTIEYIFPQWFIPASVINEARRKVMMAPNEEQIIIVDYKFETSGYENPEDCMSLFREDIAVNSQHYHWHAFHPSSWRSSSRVIKDRKGELFFYLHRQYGARYDADRIACGLPITIPLQDFSLPITEGYDPKLLSNISGSYYSARLPNTTVQDVGSVTVSKLKTWLANINKVIQTGKLGSKDSKDLVPIPEPGGISVIGEITEPNMHSTYYNPTAFGNYHGNGHIIISKCNDPTNVNVVPGVMFIPAVSMRDPVFYCWHKQIDNIASKYQMRLPPYTQAQLTIPKVRIVSISAHGNTSGVNVLNTYYQQRIVSITEGVDFGGNNPINVKVAHLQHEEFYHNITIVNEGDKDETYTVRIQIAPAHYANGTEILFPEQRTLFIAMDLFLATVPPGQHEIIRKSRDSSVTIPLGLSFLQLGLNTQSYDREKYCGCGWPDHMLLPRGTVGGMKFVYFVMVTPGSEYNETIEDPYHCSTAPVYCGLVNQKYPDSRPMGFPLERALGNSTQKIAEFAASIPNIMISEITIQHNKTLFDQNGDYISTMQ